MSNLTEKQIQEILDNPVDPKLKPAKHVRRVRAPRVCATCKHFIIVDGFGLCRREGGWGGDSGDLDQWYHTCDRYVPEGH